MNMLKFLQWQFRGCLRSLSFWGFMMFVVATVMLLLGSSTAVFAAVLALSLGLILVDAGISWFRFSYSLFEIEQTRVKREQRDTAA